jgi:hypothetical protein
MKLLSKQLKVKLDEAVLFTTMRLQHDTLLLRKVQYSRPSKFAVFVSEYINTTLEVRLLMKGCDSFFDTDFDKRVSLVEASLCRLYSNNRLYKDKLSVPVLKGMKKKLENPRLEIGYMVCYWPLDILDKLANS